MSLNTWKEEFYLEAAHVTDEKEAVEHSILKWIGLRPENLQKHRLYKDDNVIIDSETEITMRMYDLTCALCTITIQTWSRDCRICPYFLKHGSICCFDSQSPYIIWCNTGDPEPMIKALEKLR